MFFLFIARLLASAALLHNLFVKKTMSRVYSRKANLKQIDLTRRVCQQSGVFMVYVYLQLAALTNCLISSKLHHFEYRMNQIYL